MRMTAFSPISLSHTMPSAKPAPSVAEQAKPLALQPASGDTFTAVSAQKAENRSGLNAIWDAQKVKRTIEVLARLRQDYYAFAIKQAEKGYDVLEFALKLGGDIEYKLARSHNRDELYLVDYRDEKPELLISFGVEAFRNTGKMIKVQSLLNGLGAVLQRKELRPNQNEFVTSTWLHPHMGKGLGEPAMKIPVALLSNEPIYQVAKDDQIHTLFVECQDLANQLFDANSHLLYGNRD